jgi:hypothetical protein
VSAYENPLFSVTTSLTKFGIAPDTHIPPSHDTLGIVAESSRTSVREFTPVPSAAQVRRSIVPLAVLEW